MATGKTNNPYDSVSGVLKLSTPDNRSVPVRIIRLGPPLRRTRGWYFVGGPDASPLVRAHPLYRAAFVRGPGNFDLLHTEGSAFGPQTFEVQLSGHTRTPDGVRRCKLRRRSTGTWVEHAPCGRRCYDPDHPGLHGR